jgi:hypothetical protein
MADARQNIVSTRSTDRSMRPRHRFRIALVSVFAAAGLVIGGLIVMRSHNSQGNRDWDVVFHGYGPGLRSTQSNGVAELTLEPNGATQQNTTHAVLAVSKTSAEEFDPCADTVISAEMRTTAQLRSGSPPNPWEAAWFVWRYVDPEHFYYLTLKPNGWEIGKRDPAFAGGQRFLVSGESSTYPPSATWHSIVVTLKGAAMDVQVDGAQLARYTDNQDPYPCGRIALYTEDARVGFRNIRWK